MVAKDIMTRDVVTVRPHMPVKDVATRMVQHRISATPVVDARGKLVGIVSEADILSRKGKQARTIMSKQVVCVEEETSVAEIAEVMVMHGVNRVPVMQGSTMVGVVSRADIIRAIALGEHFTLYSPIYDL
jgi:CBS domain-containing protein